MGRTGDDVDERRRAFLVEEERDTYALPPYPWICLPSVGACGGEKNPGASALHTRGGFAPSSKRGKGSRARKSSRVRVIKSNASARPPTALYLAAALSPLFLASPPPRRWGASGYRGVRTRPSGAFSTEIQSGEMRLGLGTFDTAHEAARVYDAEAWCLRRHRREMNFPDVPTRERAQEFAPPPRLITNEDCRDNYRRERRLGIAEMDEEAMALWRQRFPHDVINEREFYAQRRAEREERRAERAAYREDRCTRKATAQFNIDLGAASSWDSEDDRYLDAFIETSEEDITEAESEEEEDIIESKSEEEGEE
ncbi:uncharacterized protein [Aegilops tauschii subsp. strangulata]|uniref:uncharacterized protein n=1 Tax=Aegilops tauschii subsp. strangulata TaxID=200361 RepID=UPI003CC84E2D